MTHYAIYRWVTNVWVKYSDSILVCRCQPVSKRWTSRLLFIHKYKSGEGFCNQKSCFFQFRWKYPLSFTPSLTSQKDAWSPWRAGWMDVEISPHWRNHISRNPNLALTFDFSTLLTCLDHGSSWLRPPHRGERGKPRRRSWSQPETFKLLPSSMNLQCDDGKVGILTFFGAQSNIGLLRFSRMWKLGFLGGSSSLSGVGGLLVSGTECWKLKTI